jgi:DNA modification methylase
LKSKWYQSPINKSDKDLYDHPTIKPLELVKRHILHITQEKDIVLDTFLGSGTTAVACKETNRNYIGYENNEEYFKIAVDRLNNITQVERRMKDNGVLNIFDFLGDE